MLHKLMLLSLIITAQSTICAQSTQDDNQNYWGQHEKEAYLYLSSVDNEQLKADLVAAHIEGGAENRQEAEFLVNEWTTFYLIADTLRVLRQAQDIYPELCEKLTSEDLDRQKVKQTKALTQYDRTKNLFDIAKTESSVCELTRLVLMNELMRAEIDVELARRLECASIDVFTIDGARKCCRLIEEQVEKDAPSRHPSVMTGKQDARLK